MTSVKRRIVAFVGAALMAGTMAMGVSAANNPRKYKPSGSNLGYLYYTNKYSYPVEFHYSNVVKPR